MSRTRSVGRNVTFYNAAQPDVALGGLVQNGSITEENFLDILGILLVVEEGPLHVQASISNHIVSRTQMPLQTGAYDVSCQGSIQTNREEQFRIEIRARDRKCVISGLSNPEELIAEDSWDGFEAAHIFPLRHESLWVHYNYGRWITDMGAAIGSSRINSPQNGFLLQPTIHQMFDRHLVSVNPDDGYKVVVFTINFIGCDGRILDPACRNPADPHRVSDNLLRWHFRQSVLANMRGAGELIFEHDFPPGTDTAGKVLAGLDSQARSEWVIATGLREVS
ncbi:HNH endonuclease-domain-containing protein [Tuber brumale]|nr:HNH endonuclease-domain-containing protein [Tuber brumale]